MPFLRRRSVVASESEKPVRAGLDRSTSAQRPSVLPRAASAMDLAASARKRAAANSTVKADVPSEPAVASSSRKSEDDSQSRRNAVMDREESPPIQEQSPKHRRFSRLRFRNASDSQLSSRARQQAIAEKPPPIPHPPEIITTAPTFELNDPPKKQSRLKLSSRARKSGDEVPQAPSDLPAREPSKKERRKTLLPRSLTRSKQSVIFDGSDLPSSLSNHDSANPEGNGSSGTRPALPTGRMSESARSERIVGDQHVYDSYRSSKSTASASAFFKLPHRRPKLPEPLFPIAHLQQKGNGQGSASASASKTSLHTGAQEAPSRPSASGSTDHGIRERTDDSRPSTGNGTASHQAQSTKALSGRQGISPAAALFRPSSKHSGQSSPTRAHLYLRERSSTLSSLGRNSPRVSIDEHPVPATTRTSSSTGRRSFGDLLGLSRLRQSSEPNTGRQGSLTPATPGSSTSKNNSLQIARDPIILPERREDDTPAKYLARLQDVLSRSVVAAALSKGTDAFFKSVLRSYMRGFSFFGDPMDMSIRKLLMEAELPKETQQIDRFLQAFSDRYHECNPGIYSMPDQAYFIAFSLLILHTDVFNKNNKHKMQKADYLKNTRGEGIFDEVLEVFYDNITYTPFIHVEDDFDLTGDRIVNINQKNKRKTILPSNNMDALKKATKEPIDPYTLILDGKLDILRPNLKDVMALDDHYSYIGTAKSLDLQELQKTFFRTGVLQIVSARSRPDAFMNPTSPEEAHPGIVDIKVTKVGVLWRKEAKKRRTRSPWQEWGAILTGAQLYFFRNTAWVRNLMHQFETHVRQGHDGMPVIFKPPLDQFKPDALMSTDGAVALLDFEYKRHKNAFTYVRHGGFEEVFLADNEDEMNDWLAKLNYAAAFRTSGVRIRGVVGGSYDGQSRRAMRRLDPDTVQNPSGETVTIARSRIDQKMAHEISSARRDLLLQKVSEANEVLNASEKQLEIQLRNARHLQILAPIQPKTRDQMLLSAAKMAAQLKWSRMEIWKVRCHRDILLLDLEEERQILGLPPEIIPEKVTSAEEAGAHHEEHKKNARATSQRSPRSLAHAVSIRTSTVTAPSEAESPLTDIFQTPPTSATAASFHKKQNSWELPPLAFERTSSLRKTSVSSAVSSNSITATPPRHITTASSAPEKRPATAGQQDEVDAGERNLLERAGLITPDKSHSVASKMTASPAATPGDDTRRERRDRGGSGGASTTAAGERSMDRTKVRRSLQRTLRESAGHLSHHRSKKGKDSASSGGGMSDETARPESEVLARGSGSFVVHGKKASVITFGDGLQQILVPEERLRQRVAHQQHGEPGGHPHEDEAVAGTAPRVNGDRHGEGGEQRDGKDGTEDFQDVLDDMQRGRDAKARERRESAATASTATARSFRELHRKYSARTASAGAAGAAGTTLVVPSDEDSDAAVSFSEGRRSPLPPIDGEDEEETFKGRTARIDFGGDGTEEGEEDGGEEGDETDEDDDADANGVEDRQAQFFTPEPPGSPAMDPEKGEEGKRKDGSTTDLERLPSPPLQIVSA